MKKSQELRDEITELRSEVTAIIETAESDERELLDDEQARVDEVLNEGGLIEKAEATLERTLKIEANKKAAVLATLGPKLDQQLADNGNAPVRVPARAKTRQLTCFKNEEDAYLSGQYIMAHVMGNESSLEWCNNNGIKAAMTTGNNPKGGYLVPEPLEASIIELRETYGVARANCMVVPMAEANNTWPKLNSELTTYYVGENTAITASDVAVEQVRLEARKLATLTTVSSELNDDSVISVAEMLARSIAQQFALAEDNALFLGDGTSTYGGIVGLPDGGVLGAGSIKTAASGNTSFAELDLADFEAVAAALATYATANAKWYISRQGYWLSMANLVNALGGNAVADINMGPGESQFLGFPVVFTQVLPTDSAATVNTHMCYLADLSTGVLFGNRMGISVVADESFYFSQDAIAIRGIQRFDINAHDRGTATLGGAIIALDTPNS